MTPEQKERIEQIRDRKQGVDVDNWYRHQAFPLVEARKDIDFLVAVVDCLTRRQSVKAIANDEDKVLADDIMRSVVWTQHEDSQHEHFILLEDKRHLKKRIIDALAIVRAEERARHEPSTTKAEGS